MNELNRPALRAIALATFLTLVPITLLVPGLTELVSVAHGGTRFQSHLFAIVRTPADLEVETGTPGGAIYGTAAHGAIRSLRPANRSPIRGVFLAGGTVHPGGGLPLAALSARTVARVIGPA